MPLMVATIKSSEKPALTSLMIEPLLYVCWATSSGQIARNTIARKLLRTFPPYDSRQPRPSKNGKKIIG
jgi:hypothetical protein